MDFSTAMLSDHAIRRAKSRGITRDQITVTLQVGREIHSDGCLVKFIGQREVEEHHLSADIHGLCAVLTEDGRVMVTVYKNPDAAWKFSRKSERGYARKCERGEGVRCRLPQ